MVKALTCMLLGMAVLWIVGGTTGRNATADPRPANKGPTRIALIDMAKLFQTSRSFENKRNALKQQISSSEETAKVMSAELTQMKQKYDSLEKGAEDRADLEKRMKVLNAEYEKYTKAESQKFQKGESKIYHEVYELANAAVAKYSREHEIDLVIRFNAEPFKEEEDLQKLTQSMNRQIVYENGLDITDAIIEAMN